VASWEELAQLSPDPIRETNLFPLGFRPLSHPLHTVGHQLFPQMWTRVHPEHERFDVEFDIPEAYPPEFPPPLFLTTRPDLGDVSRGYEITQANFHELFDGIITPEQMEGLRLLVTKFPTMTSGSLLWRTPSSSSTSFFELKLNREEKQDLVAFLRTL
jgi:cytochrome c peroxidase